MAHGYRLLCGEPVGPVGLGCMGMSFSYTTGGWDEAQSIAVIRQALDLGAGLIDTADVYGPFVNETLIGKALAGGCREKAFLVSKGGLVTQSAAGGGHVKPDGRPEHLWAAVRGSLARLGTDYLDLYLLHRVDARVPLEDSWGALADMVTAGLVRNIGMSEISVGEIERAQRVHPVAAVESEFSYFSPDALEDVIPWCAANEAQFIAYASLGRGYLTGRYRSREQFASGDRRLRLPRFAADAMSANYQIIEQIGSVAARHGCTEGQVALAWILAKGDHIIPLAGTRRSDHLAENLGAAAVMLEEADVRLLDAIPGPAEPRY